MNTLGFFATFLHLILSVISEPILDTHIGKFEGKTLKFGADKQIDAFYGIPFARPPTEERRFEV